MTAIYEFIPPRHWDEASIIQFKSTVISELKKKIEMIENEIMALKVNRVLAKGVG